MLKLPLNPNQSINCAHNICWRESPVTSADYIGQ